MIFLTKVGYHIRLLYTWATFPFVYEKWKFFVLNYFLQCVKRHIWLSLHILQATYLKIYLLYILKSHKNVLLIWACDILPPVETCNSLINATVEVVIVERTVVKEYHILVNFLQRFGGYFPKILITSSVAIFLHFKSMYHAW